MGGGALYEGLPHPHPTISYWQRTPSHLANHRTTKELAKKAEYVIVGSGITGASIATKLLQRRPDADVLILEARTACSGATGRNGGHCRAGFWNRFKGYLEKYGAEEALKLERFELDCIRNVTDYIRNENIRCDLTALETFDVYLEEEELTDALENLQARKGLHHGGKSSLEHRVYRGQEARDYFKMPKIAGGVTYDGYSLWPYKLVCAMLERVILAGGNLQTTTPVLSVHRAGKKDNDGEDEYSSYPWTVKTERGHVRAKQVILASNAYSGAVYGPLGESGFIIPTRGQISAIRPGSKMAHDPVLARSAGLVGHGIGDYMITMPEGSRGAGDIIYGGGRDLSKTKERPVVDDSVINPQIAGYLEGAAMDYFGPDNWGEPGKTLMEWTGIMGYTKDHLPLIGEVPGQKGLWICAGFNGHGMALTFQSAEAVVESMVDEKIPEWLPKCLRAARAFE